MADILIGVTGGAAAFKAVSLASMFRKAGHRVKSILSPGGREFISPVQLSAVTGEPCHTELFNDDNLIPHIQLASGLDLMVVAPATAHFIARAAHGFADDLLTASFLACSAPVVMAPAMNTGMWKNPAVVHNVSVLRERGIVFAGPVQGKLACGTTGAGRLMEPADIYRICCDVLKGER